MIFFSHLPQNILYQNDKVSFEKNLNKKQSLFSDLLFFEIIFKNKINNLFKRQNFSYTENNNIFHEKAKKQIQKATQEAIKQKNDIFDNLTLGFWTGLFHQHYHYHMWQKNNNIEIIFPSLKSAERNLVTIAKDLDNIRIFRNNLCHFSNIENSNLNINSHLLTKYTKGLIV